MMSYVPNTCCDCGSGRKYDECCGQSQLLDDPSIEMIPDQFWGASYHNIKQNVIAAKAFQRYNSAQILKLLAVLQVQPLNQGKYVRIEVAIIETLNNLNLNGGDVSVGTLLKEIVKSCPLSHDEDPPEEFFTENVVFENENFIVFTGINTDATEIVQRLLNCLAYQDHLPEAFIDEVSAGAWLLLSIHDIIARSLGFSHRMFEESVTNYLHTPNVGSTPSLMKLFSFNETRIAELCTDADVDVEIFHRFVYDPKDYTAKPQAGAGNPLLKRPFAKVGEDIILVFPADELACLSDFIIATADKYNCLSALLQIQEELGMQELNRDLMMMDWRFQDFTFSDPFDAKYFLVKESLWKIDHNKLAYVLLMTIQSRPVFEFTKVSSEYQKRVEAQIVHIQKQYPGFQIMVVGVIQRSKALVQFGLDCEGFKGATLQLVFSLLQLQVLTKVWKLDKLSLWKYSRAYKMALDKNIQFMAANTHYSKYEWYMRNSESFFDPDAAPLTAYVFGFEIESRIRRTGLAKFDKIGILFPAWGKITMKQCYRKDEYLPVYISQDVNRGRLTNCLLRYSCPIWFIPQGEHSFRGDSFCFAILYWLNAMYDSFNGFINLLGDQPVVFYLELDGLSENIHNAEAADTRNSSFAYGVYEKDRAVNFRIPSVMHELISQPDNNGERAMMCFVIEMFVTLIEKLGLGQNMTKSDIRRIVDSAMTDPLRKMLILAVDYRVPKIVNVDVRAARLIPKFDTSCLLQDQVAGLHYKAPIPESIKDREGKIKLFNDLVTLHFKNLVEAIEAYDALPLLIFLMRRHESMIYHKDTRKINFPAKQTTYSQFYNVFEEFRESEAESIFSGLAMRILIEFVACLMPKGACAPNDDDVDRMLATTGRIINYGSHSDELKYDIRDFAVGLLPSGRIGIDRSARKQGIESFSNLVLKQEFDSYGEQYEQVFRSRSPKQSPDEAKMAYTKGVNNGFKEEWGVGLYDVMGISEILAISIFTGGKSVEILTQEEIIDLVSPAGYIDQVIIAFLRLLTFPERTDILQAPPGYVKEEVYPWRYDRRISYMMKPLIRIFAGGNTKFIISARHLWMASENIVYGFYDGTLKVDKGLKKIPQLIADRNGIKGDEYRQEVYEWLLQNTELQVYEFEMKISPHGFFSAAKDMGDIDILAIDHKKYIIYSIECKNTHQAKTAYEFRMEIDTYLGLAPRKGLISKHVSRDKWLHDHRMDVLTRLGLSEKYKIFSLVVSKHILPTGFLRPTELKIISFHELKNNGLPTSIPKAKW